MVHKLGGDKGLMCCSWFIWSGEDILRGVQTTVLFSFDLLVSFAIVGSLDYLGQLSFY